VNLSNTSFGTTYVVGRPSLGSENPLLFDLIDASFQFAAQLVEDIKIAKKARMTDNLNMRTSQPLLYD
jgi:hypothetical protein